MLAIKDTPAYWKPNMMPTTHLTLRSLSATAVRLPMARPLGTSAQKIDVASLLLVDLETHEGVGGFAYAFCYLPSILDRWCRRLPN
jgi:mandelate racemase